MSPFLSEGAVFARRYRVERCLGAGGMGAIYEVIHQETGRRCALKALLPIHASNPGLVARFQREARLLARIESKHVVEILDAGTDPATDLPFLVLELLRGEDVGARCARFGRLPPSEVADVFTQAARGLDAMHRAGIVHRDVKPENLFRDESPDGTAGVKVLDLGIARFATSAEGARTTLILGTPVFMAPEQFVPGAEISARTDVFALGLVAFSLLVGGDYWADELAALGSVAAFAAHAALGPRERPSARAARAGVSLPAAFDGWFERATALSPHDRFASASEAASALGRVLGGLDPERERGLAWRRRSAITLELEAFHRNLSLSAFTIPKVTTWRESAVRHAPWMFGVAFFATIGGLGAGLSLDGASPTRLARGVSMAVSRTATVGGSALGEPSAPDRLVDLGVRAPDLLGPTDRGPGDAAAAMPEPPPAARGGAKGRRVPPSKPVHTRNWSG